MNDCDPCRKKKCGSPCGCAEPVFSVETMPEDPTVLRFNVNGKSVWYDFSPVVKAGETATTLTLDTVARTLNHYGERSTQVISAKELGSIFHLSDLGDVDANSIDDNGILSFHKNSNCPDGCEGVNNGWTAENPIKNGVEGLDYVMGTDEEGRLETLIPPTDPNKFRYLAWRAQNKAGWATPTIVSTPPRNSDNTVTQLYLDETTGEIVAVRKEA